jgi:hypothetical protein
MFAVLQKLKRIIKDKPYRRSWGYRVRLGPSNTSASSLYYLTSATIVKDEAKYIREFVAFHKLVGIDHMLIYMDGGYDQSIFAQLQDFLAEGFVELISWPRVYPQKNNQFLAYKDAAERMFAKTKWLAMIDADEFLFAPASDNLRGELQKREQFPAISVYSYTFGTGGVEKIPNGDLVAETLILRGPDEHVKNRTQRTIVQPSAVAAIRSANTVVLHSTDCLGWDEAGKPVYATGEKDHDSKYLRIHHYFTRAEEDFRAKINRAYFGKSDYAIKMAGKKIEAVDETLSVVKDTTLHRYLPSIKQLMWPDMFKNQDESITESLRQ